MHPGNCKCYKCYPVIDQVEDLRKILCAVNEGLQEVFARLSDLEDEVFQDEDDPLEDEDPQEDVMATQDAVMQVSQPYPTGLSDNVATLNSTTATTVQLPTLPLPHHKDTGSVVIQYSTLTTPTLDTLHTT